VAVWLLSCSGMVLLMVWIGGVTRLTGSGLSMVDWAPVTQWFPPLSEARWQEVFALYQTSPEFLLINPDMNLEGFKGIFWLEYIHRLIGRVTGMVFMLPLAYFVMRGRIDRPFMLRLLTLLFLGGAQGVLGWYMVKSGLVHDPHVSPYRLTAHLSMALLLYVYLFWLALDRLRLSSGLSPVVSVPESGTARASVRQLAWFILLLGTITLMSGGFVAGLKAGLAYNTFPLMGGQWFPDDYAIMVPLWHNWFENIVAVQWNHRLLATLTFFSAVLGWALLRRRELPDRLRRSLHALPAMATIQVSLGIATLLTHVSTALASAHQVGAFLLISVALVLLHESRFRP
jgi:cytochrome c oxidase assembly protein subunit 15